MENVKKVMNLRSSKNDVIEIFKNLFSKLSFSFHHECPNNGFPKMFRDFYSGRHFTAVLHYVVSQIFKMVRHI